MLTKKALPVGTIFIVLVIMLALLGLGYALWSDTLVINGTVHTGNVDMAFSPCSTNDTGIDFGYDKDVASCVCDTLAGDSAEGTSDTGPDALNITIENGYPSYSCEVTYDMTNVGSIPVHLYSVTEDYDPSALDYTQECSDAQQQSVGPGYQLHPEEHVYCTIGLHVRQEAEQGGTYTLHKEYWWGQYNEAPPPIVEPGFSSLTEAAAVRFRGDSTGNEIYLGIPDLGDTPPQQRVEIAYPDVYTIWADGTYAVTFGFNQPENKITTSINGPMGAASTEYDFDDLLSPGCPTANWNTMDILVLDRLTTGAIAFNNVVLNGFPLGNFGTFDVPGAPGWASANSTVTGFDFSQTWTIAGDLMVSGWTNSENNKLQITVGCLP